MTPVVPPWLFYLVYICGNLSFIFDVFSIIALIVCGITLVANILFYADASWDEGSARIAKIISKILLKVLAPVTIALIVLSCIVPNDEVITQMIVAQNVTYDRVDDAAGVVRDVYEDIMGLLNKDGDTDA